MQQLVFHTDVRQILMYKTNVNAKAVGAKRDFRYSSCGCAININSDF